MSTPIVRHHAVALLAEEKHLRIPCVRIQWPSVRKNDRRSRAPIFIENRSAIFRCDPVHVSFSLNLFLPRGSACGFGLTGSSRKGKPRDRQRGGAADENLSA